MLNWVNNMKSEYSWLLQLGCAERMHLSCRAVSQAIFIPHTFKEAKAVGMGKLSTQSQRNFSMKSKPLQSTWFTLQWWAEAGVGKKGHFQRKPWNVVCGAIDPLVKNHTVLCHCPARCGPRINAERGEMVSGFVRLSLVWTHVLFANDFSTYSICKCMLLL